MTAFVAGVNAGLPLDDIAGMFLPVVRNLQQMDQAGFGKDYGDKGVQIVAINSNDVEAYPADSPENMKKTAAEWRLTFPYVFDEDQSVAKAYRAACTPDFFVFDGEQKLAYRGQLDGSRPGNVLTIGGRWNF